MSRVFFGSGLLICIIFHFCDINIRLIWYPFYTFLILCLNAHIKGNPLSFCLCSCVPFFLFAPCFFSRRVSFLVDFSTVHQLLVLLPLPWSISIPFSFRSSSLILWSCSHNLFLGRSRALWSWSPNQLKQLRMSCTVLCALWINHQSGLDPEGINQTWSYVTYLRTDAKI